eukprot:COSAG06_NODE_40752_length_398_cov_868.571906_1_plen_132_part_11
MQHDIYESMAAGVENAACVVCFLSQKYQDSENCKLELKFAKQSGVPIVPVMAESTRGWRPSGWLGIVVAGSLWTPLGEGSDFDSGVRSLVEQIRAQCPAWVMEYLMMRTAQRKQRRSVLVPALSFVLSWIVC